MAVLAIVNMLLLSVGFLPGLLKKNRTANR
jgi:hypothetical protein